LAHLAKLNNMGVAANEGGIMGGVMIVPMTAAPEDWQQAAMASQAKLKHNAGD
jgi:hypothetical protein